MPSSPTQTDLIALARSIAALHALDPSLVCAVIEQESSWNTYSMRYEPGFRVRYVAPLGLPPTEEVARSTSWGLMQVMGQVAREHGFSAKFLCGLSDPAAGIETGCVVLASKLAESAGDISKALLLWNGGADADYAGEVLARMEKFRAA